MKSMISKHISQIYHAINTAQGQTFKETGTDLATPAFSHGMLYDFLLQVDTREKKTKSIVYKDVL